MHTISTNRPTKRNLWGCCLLLLGLLIPGAGLSAAGIPEPDTILYGKVFHRHHIYELVVTNGTLDWTIRLDETGGRTVRLTTELEPLASGEISYRLKVPHEAFVAGFSAADLSAEAIPLANGDERYRHHEIRVNGTLARILPPASNVFDAGQGRRLTAYRLDLAALLSTPDTDGDGMPDWWEERFGFDKFFNDASLDRDGDGLSNLTEFDLGSDPGVGDAAPKIVWENTAIGEGATEIVVLEAVDSDTPATNLVYTLVEAPVGAQFRLLFGATAPGPNGQFGDLPLQAGDTFTQTQVNAGLLALQHTDLSQSTITFRIRLTDGDTNHTPFETTVAMHVHKPSSEDGTGAALWTDAAHAASQSASTVLTNWADRSGPKPWLSGPNAPYDAHAGAIPLSLTNQGPLGQPVLAFNVPGVPLPPVAPGLPTTQYLAPPAASEARVFHDSNVTVFAVFQPRADGTHRGQIVNGPHFQLTMTGAENHGRESQVRFATESAGVVYGNHDIHDRWSLVTAWADQGLLTMQLNGGWVGGPHPQGETAEFGSDPLIGGRSLFETDPNTGEPHQSVDEPFEGCIGEILVFNRTLEDVERERINYQLLSKWFGWVLLDGSEEFRDLNWRVASSGLGGNAYQTNFLPRFGRDRNYIFLGGAGQDVLQGGHEDDIFVGGMSSDRLTGFGGRDVFVFNQMDQGSGHDTITDFNPGQHDAIDLTDLLRGDSRNLGDYVRLRTDGHHSYLEVDVEGGGQYDDHTIVLQNIVLRDADLYGLWARTNLITGDKRFPLPVTITATTPTATEITGQAAEFTLHFDGQSVPDGLEIPFEISGTADRNVDYRLSVRTYNATNDTYSWQPVPGHELFVSEKVGDLDFVIRVEPIPDSHAEATETVRLHLTAVPEYFDLVLAEATVQIVDGPQRIAVTATDAQASEADDNGAFVIRREGSTDIPLDARVQMTGPAQNGIDYSFIASVVHFNAGQTQATVLVTPFADVTRELAEAVEMVLLPGDGYLINPAGQVATVMIEDAGPVLSIEAIEPLAVVQDLVPGAFLVRRRGVVSDNLTVLLELTGTATPNRDYRRINAFVTLLPGATTAILLVDPLSGATISGGVESVIAKVLPDAAYAIGAGSTAEVRIVSTTVDFAQWKAVRFPGNATPPAIFAGQDFDGDGLLNVIEYGFGLDPTVPSFGAPGLPRPVIVNGRLAVRFTRPVAVVDVDYLVEVSGDLQSWQPADDFDELPGVLVGSGNEEVTFLDRRLVGESVHRFVRVSLLLR